MVDLEVGTSLFELHSLVERVRLELSLGGWINLLSLE